MTSLATGFLIPKLEKKRILLIATYATKRDLRARVLRKLGVEVDCAADVSEARELWRVGAYNLVLVDVRNDSINVEEFCVEIKSAKPPQRIAYLVGKPGYLADSAGSDASLPLAFGEINEAPWAKTVAALFTTACEGLSRRWGFQEASLRIAATRSLNDPRLQQMPANGKGPHWSWTDAVKHHLKSSQMKTGVPVDLPALASMNVQKNALVKEEIS